MLFYKEATPKKRKKQPPKDKPKPFPTSLMSYTFHAAAKTTSVISWKCKESWENDFLTISVHQRFEDSQTKTEQR